MSYFRGAEDGYTVRPYNAGERYFVLNSFADSVIKSGLAKSVVFDDLSPSEDQPRRRGRRRK